MYQVIMKLNLLLALVPAALHVAAMRPFERRERASLDPSTPLPGIHVDLNEQRLLEFEDGSKVWVTELEKMEIQMSGERFFDM